MFKPDFSGAKTTSKTGPSTDEEDAYLANLKVNYTVIYEELLSLPPNYTRPTPLSQSVFSPPPVHNHDLAFLFEEETINGTLHVNLDYVAMVEMFYPLVHPDCDEFFLRIPTPESCAITPSATLPYFRTSSLTIPLPAVSWTFVPECVPCTTVAIYDLFRARGACTRHHELEWPGLAASQGPVSYRKNEVLALPLLLFI
jgi:hypothetical protein